MKIFKFFSTCLLVTALLLTPSKVLANNIFGLHLTQTEDINQASKIINSTNGDWGWITIVIRTDQLDLNTWQNFFDSARKLHIIPILRLATTSQGNYWKRPTITDIDNLAIFLNSLNWPTKNQYVILFNEINHGSEWGGEVDIKNYADMAIYASKKLKDLNSNFIILGSPLDLAAPENMPKFKSADNVYKEIYAYRPEYFKSFDALASHSYPNHGFIGTPQDVGRHSIRGYQWELNFIKNLNNKTYPVFITETGWPHREGEKNENKFYTAKTTADFLKSALDIWSKDTSVVAVTPFIYNYPNFPFDHFSWLTSNQTIYPEYQQIIDLPKSQNHPEQTTKYEAIKIHLPLLIFTNYEYLGQIYLKNTGQSIWGETKFCLNPKTTTNIVLESICTDNDLVLPNQIKIFNFKFKIKTASNIYEKKYLKWEGLAGFEIMPLNSNSSIYRPKTGIGEKIITLFKQILQKLIK